MFKILKTCKDGFNPAKKMLSPMKLKAAVAPCLTNRIAAFRLFFGWSVANAGTLKRQQQQSFRRKGNVEEVFEKFENLKLDTLNTDRK